MAVNFGSAIARGLVKGLGEGYSTHLEEQRREKREARQLDNTFNMFKKQQQYSFGLQQIGKMNESLGTWETAAKMSTGDLAYQVATKMSSQFSKEDRPKFFRDAMKQLNGLSKAELLSRAGYNKPDYSAYIDNPDYQDAIPRGRIAGMADMPDMTETFKYDPRAYAQEQKAQGEKMTDYMRKKNDEFQSINSMGVMQFGKQLSDEVKNFIWKNRPEGMSVEMKGAEAISYDQNLLTSLVNSGQVVPVGSELKFVGELTPDEQTLFGVGEEAQPTPEEAPVVPTPLYTEPKTEAYLTEQEQKEHTKVQRQEAKNVEKNYGKTIKAYTSLGDLRSQLEALSPEAQSILFGDASLRGLLSLTDVGKQLAAKADVAGAKEARKFLSLMENISATLKHEQYGSAQTKTEMESFADQLGNPGILQNPETLIDQIQTRMDLVGGDLQAAVGQTGAEAYLAEHPDLQEELGGIFGQIGQVSDTAEAPTPDTAAVKAEITQFVDSLIASGEYDESQRAALQAHLEQRALQPIQ